MSSVTVEIQSATQFNTLLTTSKILVADFYATWCGPCKQVAPIYEQLSAQLSRPNKITFVKIDSDRQQDLTRKYQISSLPSFIIFKNGQVLQKIQGADPKQLSSAVRKLANEAVEEGADTSNSAISSSTSPWVAAAPPKPYSNVTDQVDLQGLELLNFDDSLGTVRTLFDAKRPSSLDGGKKEASSKDWVESDTDDQLMLFIPFQSTLKVHSLQLTSVVAKSTEEEEQDEAGDEEPPVHPKTIQIYTNRPHILGFEEADDIQPTQSITLEPKEWDAATGTATLELRFVKFQNVTSLVIYVVSGEDQDKKVRLDRVRIIGETGEKRGGKIEKMADGED